MTRSRIGTDERGIVLQERDRRLLRELAVMRIIDREQAATVAGYGSVSRVNRRLRELTRVGLLKRFFLGTRISGQKALYSLSKRGARAVSVPHRALQRRQDESLVADYFVEHQLTVNELFCAVKYGAMPSGVAFESWRAFYQPLTQGIRLIPDGFFELRTPTETISAFVEVDLGHERGSVWREKVKRYLELAVFGEYERMFHRSRFRVIVLARTERRLLSIRSVTATMTNKIFWFATLDAIQGSQGISAPVWLRPKGMERQVFIEAPNP